MQWTPDDIAASIGNDPAIKPEDILYKYLKEDAQVRYEALKEYFAGFGLSLTEQEMVRLMAIQEDILFTEASDGRGRFWQASIAPGQQAGPREGYLDHRITDQFDDAMGQDFDDEEEDFTGRDLAGINATPQAGEMGSLNGEGAPSDLGGFDTQEGMPDATGAATDETEVPPAAIPQAMPDMVAQAMAAQMGMPDPATQAMAAQMGMPGEPGMPGESPIAPDALEPGMPEPGMQPGQDQLDMEQPPAEQGPGEEMPAPQTGAVPVAIPQMIAPQVMAGQAPQMVAPGQAPQMAVPGQAQVAQQPAVEPEPDFGQDGADYTIDPLLNALKGMTDQQDTPERYSGRMREARKDRLQTLTG